MTDQVAGHENARHENAGQIYGFSFWPIWSFHVADVVVADMVRYGTIWGRLLERTTSQTVCLYGRPLASRYGPSNGGIINHLERPLT